MKYPKKEMTRYHDPKTYKNLQNPTTYDDQGRPSHLFCQRLCRGADGTIRQCGRRLATYRYRQKTGAMYSQRKRQRKCRQKGHIDEVSGKVLRPFRTEPLPIDGRCQIMCPTPGCEAAACMRKVKKGRFKCKRHSTKKPASIPPLDPKFLKKD